MSHFSEVMSALVMPMNLLTVLLLVGITVALRKLDLTSSKKEQRLLKDVSLGWTCNFFYVLLEITSLLIFPDSVDLLDISDKKQIEILSMILNILATFFFLRGALSFHLSRRFARILTYAVASISFALVLSAYYFYGEPRNFFFFVLPSVILSVAALVLLGFGFRDFLRRNLPEPPFLLTQAVVSPFMLYAIVQFPFIFYYSSEGDLALRKSAYAISFFLAFLFKLTHFTGLASFTLSRVQRLQERQLEDKNIAEQKRFIDQMLHELSTPSAELNLQLDQLEYAALHRTNVKGEMSVTRGIVAHLLAILHGANDLLAEGRNKLAAGPDEWMDCNINNLVQSAILAIKATEPRGKSVGDINIQTSYSRNILVQCQPSRLRQVFVNVFKNSFDSLSRDGGSIHISTSRYPSGVPPKNQKALVIITDDGPGISKGEAARVWEDGFTTKEGDQRGHGLFVSREIVVQHKGSISIEPTKNVKDTKDGDDDVREDDSSHKLSENRGARVRVLLPLAPR